MEKRDLIALPDSVLELDIVAINLLLPLLPKYLEKLNIYAHDAVAYPMLPHEFAFPTTLKSLSVKYVWHSSSFYQTLSKISNLETLRIDDPHFKIDLRRIPRRIRTLHIHKIETAYIHLMPKSVKHLLISDIGSW